MISLRTSRDVPYPSQSSVCTSTQDRSMLSGRFRHVLGVSKSALLRSVSPCNGSLGPLLSEGSTTRSITQRQGSAIVRWRVHCPESGVPDPGLKRVCTNLFLCCDHPLPADGIPYTFFSNIMKTSCGGPPGVKGGLGGRLNPSGYKTATFCPTWSGAQVYAILTSQAFRSRWNCTIIVWSTFSVCSTGAAAKTSV